mmetsp:Transcript_15279/g.23006  ORF Transcript_15279/g.23006 Transcript_15279/m.23006 type:complete len:441 (+) Transcript_15279:70-1392(+)
MEFFGLTGAAELNTPAGQIVKSGTDALLLGPDWSKNMELCDHINSRNDGADAVKAIQYQLRNSDPKVVGLALTMIETCVKNCVAVPQLINRSFMEEMYNIANGRKGFHNQEEALRLIQLWGRTYERKRNELPIFFDTYMAMKTRGVRFPEEHDIDPSQLEARPARGADSGMSSSVTQAVSAQENQSNKLRSDLSVVLEKVRLCREMLPESPGIHQDETLAEVVGFLEACQERMIDLIEAGTQGLLSEDMFELTLRVNDAVLRTLEAEKTGTSIPVEDETTAPVSAKGSDNQPKAAAVEDEADEFAQLTLKTVKPASAKKAPVALKAPTSQKKSTSTTGGKLPPPPRASGGLQVPSAPAAKPVEEDDLLSMSMTPSAAPSQTQQAPPPPKPSSADDDFATLFGSSSSSRPADSEQNQSAQSAAEMTDDEFEKFLNSVGTSK